MAARNSTAPALPTHWHRELPQLAERLERRYANVKVTDCCLQRHDGAGVPDAGRTFETVAWHGSREALEAIAPAEAFRRRGFYVDEFGTTWSASERRDGTWILHRHVEAEPAATPRHVRRFPTRRAEAEVARIIRRAQRAAASGRKPAD